MASPKDAGKGKSTKRNSVSETAANQNEAKKPPFTPRTLDKTVIALPLLKKLNEERQKLEKDPSLPREVFPVIIDINLEYPGGRMDARKWVKGAIDQIISEMGSPENADRQGVNETKSDFSEQYMFAELEGDVIRELVKRDNDPKEETKDPKKPAKNGPRAIFHLWPDFEINSLINS